MSGTGHSTVQNTQTGSSRLDGILHFQRWADPVLSYGFPDTGLDYGPGYSEGEQLGILPAAARIRAATAFALDADPTPPADDGFSVEGFTALELRHSELPGAHIRVAQTTADPYHFRTAWSYFPSATESGGDVWLSDVSYDYAAARAGNYAHFVILHELGHALGLEHPHERTAFGTVPPAFDAMEYSVMSYRSHAEGTTTGYTNESWGYAQSYMMLDIAALQQMYGADYRTNSGDTVYRWTPAGGTTFVDGAAAISPGGNRIFATIWDGGGTDTYDLSAYQTGLTLRLAPGAASVFGPSQRAALGDGITAKGNIYNALLHDGDPRALIENARGGAGDDSLRGNAADNRLKGNAGDDRLMGLKGSDTLIGNAGQDLLLGGAGGDVLRGGRDCDTLKARPGPDVLRGGPGPDMAFGNIGDDRVAGNRGNDRLFGGRGADVLVGGPGRDVLTGGPGADRFLFRRCADSGADAPRPDVIRDFTTNADRIDLALLYDGRLSFLGDAGFSGTAGELRAEPVGRITRLSADCDGDGIADFLLHLRGALELSDSDFIL